MISIGRDKTIGKHIDDMYRDCLIDFPLCDCLHRMIFGRTTISSDG